jgi:anaerobic ribonucleoside-triphosphate reductase activating protein
MNPRINVAHYDFAKEILGYGLRLIIWLQGCHKRCNECITPEFQALRGGQSMTSGKLFNVIKFYIEEMHIDGITFSGGDPLIQFSNFQSLLPKLKNLYPKIDVNLYTGYSYNIQKKEFENLPSSIGNLDLTGIDLIIDGEFIKDLAGDFLLRGSSNQKLIPLTVLGQERLTFMQNNFSGNRLALSRNGSPFLMGIPSVNTLAKLDSRLQKMGIER